MSLSKSLIFLNFAQIWFVVRWISLSCYKDLSKLLHHWVNKALFPAVKLPWSPEIYKRKKTMGSDMGLFKLLHVFVKVLLCISHPLPNNTKLKLTKLVETSALNKRCWMSQSAQCIGSVVPSETFLRKLKVFLAHLHTCTYPHLYSSTIYLSYFKNWRFLVASSQKVNPGLGCQAPDSQFWTLTRTTYKTPCTWYFSLTPLFNS